MLDTIKFDDIVGIREPILKLDIKGKIFDIYALDKMSMDVAMRVLEANVQFEAANEAYQRTVQDLDREIDELLAENSKAKTSKDNKATIVATISYLNSRKTLEQSKLVIPAQVLIEAMAGMPPGTLSQSPPQAINQLFERVVQVVFPKQETTEDQPQTNSNESLTNESGRSPEVSQSSPVTATKEKKP